MKEPFKWDSHSDQPAIIINKAFKKQMRKKEFFSLAKTFLLSLVMLPVALVAMPLVKRKKIDAKTFCTLGVDFQREGKATLQMLDELEIDSILVRFKLWELDSLDELVHFLKQTKQRKITLKILQDREHIENLEALHVTMDKLFASLQEYVDIFEIGSTINRAKWGFFSVDEYLRFYQSVYNLKQTKYPGITLIGSGVIDFEYHYTAHTLFNLYKLRYDGVASLLYVDRRGAPENTQLGFSLSDKIALLASLVNLSPKTPNKLYITETNWPLKNTAPYAPTSEFECVSEEDYANFMVRYYLLAFASQQVDYVAWHQLIAPGYGLVDNREGLRKREAYHSFKYLHSILRDSQFLRLDIKREYYICQLWRNEQLVQIHWSLSETTLQHEDYFEAYDKNGNPLAADTLKISASPVYLFVTKEVGQKTNASQRVDIV